MSGLIGLSTLVEARGLQGEFGCSGMRGDMEGTEEKEFRFRLRERVRLKEVLLEPLGEDPSAGIGDILSKKMKLLLLSGSEAGSKVGSSALGLRTESCDSENCLL
jgi:hypothetical protein